MDKTGQVPFLLIGTNTTLQHQTELLPINSLFTTTTLLAYNIQSFKMKLNFLLAAAFVAAPVLAASTTTTTHTSTATAKASSKTSKAAAAPTMGADMLGVAGVAGVLAAMAL
ncbi:hypothetical protein LB507_009750 [Fusarium sp. FIESC RH6]|nr:hypothetical protein LB507_009750 [Fusarium sp. FIESC RH6]